MNVTLDWQQMAAIATTSVVVGAVVMALIRAKLARDFVPQEAHDALVERVGEVERTQRGAPTQADLTALTQRLASVESGVAVAQATLAGTAEAIKRVERMTEMLVQHQLKEDA